jgi:alpha-mannosidase
VLAESASCDTQFGFVDRPTHKNTSWDWAKFEVCAHKYVDISEGNYGVALINESKFGHGVSDNVISISLLRGPDYPDPDCDMGKHSFSYALMGHSGNLTASDVLKEATFFNNPCIAVPVTNTDCTLPASFSVVKTENEGVVIDTVKPAEDGNGTVIRMYEGKKTRGNEKLTLGVKAEKAYICDMLENELEEIAVIDNTITIPYKPFEIITVKVK